MARKLSGCAWGIAIFAGAVALLVGAWDVYWRVPGYLDFMLHSQQLVEAVHVAKTRRTRPGESGHFTLHGIRVFYVRRTATAYSVTIESGAWGHFGAAGYLYSDLPPTRTIQGDYCYVDAPGSLNMFNRQLAPHWWIVFDNRG